GWKESGRQEGRNQEGREEGRRQESRKEEITQTSRLQQVPSTGAQKHMRPMRPCKRNDETFKRSSSFLFLFHDNSRRSAHLSPSLRKMFFQRTGRKDTQSISTRPQLPGQT